MIMKWFCFFWGLALPMFAARIQPVITDFSGPEWVRSPQHVTPVRQQDRDIFPLRFQAPDRRLLVERRGPLNLAGATSFRLRVATDGPQRILEGKLIFVSGQGSYTAGFTLHNYSEEHIFLAKADFTAEGSPSGWDRIESVRFSFWPRGTGNARVFLLGLDQIVDSVQVIAGEAFARTGDERYIARVTLWHMRRLLQNLGVPHGVTPVDGIGAMPPADVIILPYAPNLTYSEVEHLRRHVRRGAKLIVFENESASLARELGVNLGPTQSSRTVGMYDQLHFHGEGWPRRVYQHAWSFRQLSPGPGASVLAVWGDARGQASSIPAAVLHANGAWFASSWRAGDLPGKQLALARLIERFAPSALAPAAHFQLRVNSPFPQTRAITSTPARLMRDRADVLWRQGIEAERRGDFSAALNLALDSVSFSERAFAANQRPWRPQIIGIWDQQGTGFYAGGWDETCRQLAEAGFTAVFPNLSSAGRAHYTSALLPGSRTLELHGDQLQQFTRAARRHGLEAHVWKINWRLNNPDPAFRERMRREGRLMRDHQGNDLNWLSFSHPENVRFEIDTILEILRLAPVDGIHLDYMRYPGREADYGPAARRTFETRIGRPVADWPGEVLGPLRGEFQRFRQDELHKAMEAIHRAVKAEFPHVTLSAAVWGAWPDCADAQGQDWPVWARNGWVDLLMPMNYTDNPHQFLGWLDLQRAQPGVADRLVPGIGVISTNAELTPRQTLNQISLSRLREARGVMLYRLDTSQPERLFPYLRSGIFRSE